MKTNAQSMANVTKYAGMRREVTNALAEMDISLNLIASLAKLGVSCSLVKQICSFLGPN